MTDHEAIGKGMELMWKYRPSRYQVTINGLNRLSRSRGLANKTRDTLTKARKEVEAGKPMKATQTVARAC